MGSDRSPAFLFYVKDWRASRKVQAMSFAVRGMYFEMLAEEWETGAAPATPAACAQLFGGTTREWTRAWPKLSICFVARARDGRLVNRKLEAVRRERLRYLKSQRENGLRGADKRWKQHGKPMGSLWGRDANPMAKHSERSGSESGSESDLGSTRTAHAEPNGRDPVRAAFEQFWNVYPKKVGKGAAWTAWRKVQPAPELVAKIFAAIGWQHTQDSWLREGGRFVPNPATWINQARWDDEPVTTPHMSDKTLSLARSGQEFLKDGTDDGRR